LVGAQSLRPVTTVTMLRGYVIRASA